MATAKLWWNGSSWVTTNTWWLNHNSEGALGFGVLSQIKITAYDNGTIGLLAKLNDTAGDGQLSGNRVIKADGSTILTLNDSNRNPAEVNVTTKTTFAYSGDVSVYRAGAGYGNPSKISGSTTITSPFCTVSFNANGGSDAPASQTVCKGASATLTASTPTRANHTFLGWATSSSAHVQDYDAGGEITTSADITLYAVWEPCVFISADEGVTITFDGVAYTNTTAAVGKTWGNEYALTIAPNTGFIIKTRSHPDGNVEIDADEITISATSQRVGCHIDDGDDWVQAVMYLDTGAEWVMVQAYVDNGAEWGLVY